MILMSNNQWKYDNNNPAWAEKGEDCSAEARSNGLLRAYTEIMPDVMGLQEASVLMSELLMNKLQKWEISDGTFANYELITGGDTPIIYRKDKLRLIESGFFRFDEHIDGLSGSFNNKDTKSFCWGVFEDRTDKKCFFLMSVHLWWKLETAQAGSDEARAFQIGQAIRKAEAVMQNYSCPGIIMGDFNADISSPCLKYAFSLGWKEVHDIAISDRDDTEGHHHCFPDGYTHPDDYGKFEDAIDHIIVKDSQSCRINHFRRLNHPWFDCLSDHYPLYIDIDF